MPNTPMLETGRLRLRRFTEADANAVFAIFSDPEVNTFLPWFPVQSLEEAERWLHERYLRTYLQPVGYRYAICRKCDDNPIGYVHVSTQESHDLGYGLCKAYWHQGIVSEACQAVIEQVRRDGMPYITATHDRNNPRSGAVMQRLGMQYRYSYEELWMPKNIPVIFRMYQKNLDGKADRVYRVYWDRATVRFYETEACGASVKSLKRKEIAYHLKNRT